MKYKYFVTKGYINRTIFSCHNLFAQLKNYYIYFDETKTASATNKSAIYLNVKMK